MPGVWDIRARLYDVCEASDLRRGPHKASLFRHMVGRVLFLAVGTGIDIRRFPPGRWIVGVDISADMLRRAESRRRRYPGVLRFVRSDAQHLGFADGSFDTVVTSCTLCSVPDPVAVLRELHQVLNRDGRLLMFEHVRSRNPVLGWTLDAMTCWTRLVGTEMNRDTARNVTRAGFRITRIDSVYQDIILAFRGVRDDRDASSASRTNERR